MEPIVAPANRHSESNRASNFQKPTVRNNGSQETKPGGIRRFLTWGKPNKARISNYEITMEPHPDAIEESQQRNIIKLNDERGKSRILTSQQQVQPIVSKAINIESIQKEIQVAFQLVAKNRNLDALVRNSTLIKKYHDLKTFYGITYAFSSRDDRTIHTTHQHSPTALADETPTNLSPTSSVKKFISDSIKNAQQYDKGKARVLEPTEHTDIDENEKTLQKAIEQHRAIKVKQLVERSLDYFPTLPKTLSYSFLLQMRKYYSTLSARLNYSQRSFLLGLKADVINQLARKIPEQYDDQLGLDIPTTKNLIEFQIVLEEMVAAKNLIVYEPEKTEQKIAEILTAVKKMIAYRSMPTKGAIPIDVFSRGQWKPIIQELFAEPIAFTPDSLVDRLLTGKLRDLVLSSSSLSNKEAFCEILKQSYNSTLISFYEMCKWHTQHTLSPETTTKKRRFEEKERLQDELWALGANRQNQALVDGAACVRGIAAFLEDESVHHLKIPLEETRVLFSKIDMIGFCRDESPIKKSEQLEIGRLHFNESLKSLCQFFNDENNVKRIRDHIKACNYRDRLNLNKVFNQIDFIRSHVFSSLKKS